jgi:dTDP-4-dehydrorhamnose reductase
MKRIIVLGGHGMAGHIITQYLEMSGKYIVQCTSRTRSRINSNTKFLDINNHEDLKEYLVSWKPNIVINCVGVLVKHAEEDLANAININSLLPHILSSLSNQVGFKLIHISTDCVFSGQKGNYIESDFRDGNDNYARTKILGEINNDRDLTIRTSIIGPELKNNGTGLLHWFLNATGEINGYSSAFWNGITTLELAKIIDSIIESELTGLVQVSSTDKISKYNLLLLANSVFNKELHIKKYDSVFIDKSLINTRKDFSYQLPSYEDMLIELFNWMKCNTNLYMHYSIITKLRKS